MIARGSGLSMACQPHVASDARSTVASCFCRTSDNNVDTAKNIERSCEITLFKCSKLAA